MVSKKPFLQKKKRKIRKLAQNSPFGWYPRCRFYKKEKKDKKSAQNLPFGWYPRRRFYKKEKKNKKIGSKLTFRMVSKKPFLQKRKENWLKTYLSDGIQEAIFRKKKENSTQNLPFG